MANRRRIPDITLDVADDGLLAPIVGRWAEDKHRHVALYAKLFSTGMKDKWDERVYIELYAGAGYSKVKDSGKVIAGSPIQALTLEHPFDKYIFCEKNPRALAALKTRVGRTSPGARVDYVEGDCNERVKEILSRIPPHSPSHRVLSLCFVDPYDIGLKFETLSILSDRFVDFLVLLALNMDANRNIDNYLKDKQVKIDEFLGSYSWRERWNLAERNGSSFPQFLAEEFSASMKTLGYKPQPFYAMKPIKNLENNVQLYRLALFSRSPRAYKFWDEVLKYTNPQKGLPFEN